MRAVLRLAQGSVAELAELDTSGGGVELRRDGLLLVARGQHGLDEATHLVREAGKAGYPGEFEVLDGDEARRREPALSGRVAGAVHARAEAHLRPEKLLGALETTLRAAGVKFVAAEALGVEPASGARWRVATAQGGIEADRVVVAAGVWSRHLLAGLGLRVPLLAGVGHTITARGRGTPPAHPMKLVEPNVAVAPFQDGVRIAARFELGPAGDHRSVRSVRRALRATAPYLGGWSPGRARVTTAGMRPATPDSLPVIGPVPGADGVFAATGHGMLGLTLAPGTARELAPLVTRGQDSAALRPFAPGRFGRHRPGRRTA